MIRHILIAAWRNMAANRLISAIAILGLVVGFTGAILMALVVRKQLTYDNFIPGHERIYLGITEGTVPGMPPWIIDRTHRQFADLLSLNIPGIESATRLMLTDQIAGGDVVFRRDDVTGGEKIYWADPNVFDVLPLPVLHGDLKTALHRPDGLVLPRAAARKYFGHDDVVGETVQLNGRPMTVRAVIEDLPANATQLETGIFASIQAPFLGFTAYKPRAPGTGFTPADIGVRTYFRLRPGASIAEVQAKSAALIKPIYGKTGIMPLVRLDRVHLVENLNAAVMAGPNAGVMASLGVAALVGLLVLFIASVNFVNLTLARAARREREIGARKVCGARRRDLILQFLGEAVITAALAGVMAMALSEWLLPKVNAFLGTGASFDYGSDPLLLPAIALAIVVAGIAAGAWPAFVLSGFAPARVLRGLAGNANGAPPLRTGLVMVQFAVLVVLAIAAAVIWQQWNYAIGDALRTSNDQMLIVRIAGKNVRCPAAFADAVRGLEGVQGAACTGLEFLDAPIAWHYPGTADSTPVLDMARIDTRVFGLYDVRPLAGQLTPLPDDDGAPQTVISSAAVKRLGFSSARAAIGQSLAYLPGTNDRRATRIIAVVPDFALYPVTRAAAPMVYIGLLQGGTPGALLHVRLHGGHIPEALAAIDRSWRDTGQPGPIDKVFLDDHMQQRYLAMLRNAQMIAVCAGLAVLLACLGLLGISIATAERRTKEIGIRKAMGADNRQIVALLLWQFAQPVLWANVIAWPAAWWLMRRWLSGFAYHVDLHWWVFAAASLGALAVALATVAGQAFLTARAKPVLALRTE